MINRYSDGRVYRPTKIGINHIPQNVTKKSGSKYGNQKTERDDIKFDSKKEAGHYTILTQLKKAGYIKDFKMQVKYILLDGYYNHLGKKIRNVEYKADFDVIDLEDNLFTLDSKGYETEVFKIKRKMFEVRYDRPLYCIKEDSELHKMFVKE